MKVRELRELLRRVADEREIRFVVDIRFDSDPNTVRIQSSDFPSNRSHVVGAIGIDLDGALVINVNYVGA